MRRTVRERSPRQPAAVEHIELNEDKLHKRFILVVLLLALGLGAIAGGVMSLLHTDPGWREIRAEASAQSCAGDFVLLYDLGRGELSASREKRLLTNAYSRACGDAYAIFHARERLPGVKNLAWLSDHVNEETSVEPALYRALEQCAAARSRLLFLAPVYEVYSSLFFAMDDSEALALDPFREEELGRWCAQAAAYAADPAAVSLELLGEDRVCLRASEEYRAFLRDSGVTELLDFYWMEEAFQADYLAQRLTAEGFPNGCLWSRRGCVRCFAPGVSPFTETLSHWDGTAVRPAAGLPLRGGMAVVTLRAWPRDAGDRGWLRVMPDGSLRSPYVDPEDGLCRTALPELTGLSESLSCGELALAMAGVFLGEGPAEETLGAWDDPVLVWTEGERLRSTAPIPDIRLGEGFTT